jgi:hypothetical protein
MNRVEWTSWTACWKTDPVVAFWMVSSLSPHVSEIDMKWTEYGKNMETIKKIWANHMISNQNMFLIFTEYIEYMNKQNSISCNSMEGISHLPWESPPTIKCHKNIAWASEDWFPPMLVKSHTGTVGRLSK